MNFPAVNREQLVSQSSVSAMYLAYHARNSGFAVAYRNSEQFVAAREFARMARADLASYLKYKAMKL